MRPIIAEQLWIGNARDVRDVSAALSLGIRGVVDLAASEPAVQYPRDISYFRFSLNDGLENEQVLLRLAVHSIAELVRAQVPTLVACSVGMSRSPAVVAAALARVQDRSPADVLHEITANEAHDVSPALWSDILRLSSLSDGKYTLASGRSVHLDQLLIREAMAGFLIGKPDLIPK